MKAKEASRTAEYAAGFRALETARRPNHARLFEDPFAASFLGPDIGRYVRWAARPLLGGLVRSYVEWISAGAMSSGIARTRLIDDWLLDSLRGGIRQVVLLGAGYDCRSCRLPELADRRVVEIDHPATQTVKKERLRRLLGVLPGHVTYQETDLINQELKKVWNSAGLNRDEPAFVLWEGVTHYLGEKAVDATLRSLASVCAPLSRLVFTYIDRGLLDGSKSFDRAHIPMARVAKGGEPWIWGMDPAHLPAYLSERGFQLLKDLGADDYRALYWGEAAHRMRGFGFYHVALAQAGIEQESTR